MRLRKIPGVKSYRAAPDGVRSALQSSGLSKVMASEAERVAGAANAVGEATYAGRPSRVRGGYDNELRAGGSVYVVEPHWRDSRDAVLLRVAESMAIRTGPVDKAREMVTYTRRDGTTRQATRAQAESWMRQRGETFRG